MSTCKIPGCTQPAKLNMFWIANGARCSGHENIGDWIPCEVAMPPIGQLVLVRGRSGWPAPKDSWYGVMAYSGPETQTIPEYVGKLVWVDRFESCYREDVTHWREIPRFPR